VRNRCNVEPIIIVAIVGTAVAGTDLFGRPRKIRGRRGPAHKPPKSPQGGAALFSMPGQRAAAASSQAIEFETVEDRLLELTDASK